MEAYTDFAELYDLFMEDTPYSEWCEIFCSILKEYDIEDGLVAELGCGTGTMTKLMAERGFDLIGIDSSIEMLEIARAKEERTDILYLLQDMREFELYGTVRSIISVCDSMNYILTEEELKTVFSLVNNYLDPGGIFLFDMNTPYKYREVLGEEVFAENLPSASFIWENDFDEETGINQYDVTFFKQHENGWYRKFEETHLQRCYEIEQVISLLKESGLKFERAFDLDTGDELKETTQRVCFVAREKDKADILQKNKKQEE